MRQPNKFLCHRHLEGRRSVALERGAAHVAHLARLLVTPGPMHGLAVVPHHEIMLPPGVGVDELSLVACSARSRTKAIASGTGQPTMPPMWEDRNSDLRPVVGLVRTRRWRTGANFT